MTKWNPWFIPACSDKQYDDDLTQENRDQELINAVLNNMPSKEIFNEILSNSLGDSLENRDEVKSCGKSMWDGILERCRLFSRNEKEFQECLRGELGWHWSRPSYIEPVLYAEHFAKTELNTMNENRKEVLNMNSLPTTMKIDAWVDIDQFKDGQNLATPKYLDGYYPLYDFRIDNGCAVTIDKIEILINDVFTVIPTNMYFDSNDNYTIKNSSITLGSTEHGRDQIDTIEGQLDPNTCILTLITTRGRVDRIHISGTVNGHTKKVEVDGNVNGDSKASIWQELVRIYEELGSIFKDTKAGKKDTIVIERILKLMRGIKDTMATELRYYPQEAKPYYDQIEKLREEYHFTPHRKEFTCATENKSENSAPDLTTEHTIYNMLIDIVDAKNGVPLTAHVTETPEEDVIKWDIMISGAYLKIHNSSGETNLVYAPTSIKLDPNDTNCSGSVKYIQYRADGTPEMVTDNLYCTISSNLTFKATSGYGIVDSIRLDGRFIIKGEE